VNNQLSKKPEVLVSATLLLLGFATIVITGLKNVLLHNLSWELFFSTLSLLIAGLALGWNIVRDILLDNVNISTKIFLGEIITDDLNRRIIMNEGTEFSSKAVSNHKIQPKELFFTMTNTGRRDVELDSIKAHYRNSTVGWSDVIFEKRYLKPYQTVNSSTNNEELIHMIKNNNVESIYCLDTKGKKWFFDISELQHD
jgi:hypothetical protein